MKKSPQHVIAEVSRRQARTDPTVGIDTGDVWSHHCTSNQDAKLWIGVVPNHVEGGRQVVYRLPPARVATAVGVHSIWISEQLQALDHDVIVASVRELRAMSYSDRKSNRWTPRSRLVMPVSIRTSYGRSPTALFEQQETLTLIRARELLVPAAHGLRERGARTDEDFWSSHAGILYPVLRRTEHDVALTAARCHGRTLRRPIRPLCVAPRGSVTRL